MPTWNQVPPHIGTEAVAEAVGHKVTYADIDEGYNDHAWLNVATGAVIALFATKPLVSGGAFELWHVVRGEAVRLGRKEWPPVDFEAADQAKDELLALARALM